MTKSEQNDLIFSLKLVMIVIILYIFVDNSQQQTHQKKCLAGDKVLLFFSFRIQFFLY